MTPDIDAVNPPTVHPDDRRDDVAEPDSYGDRDEVWVFVPAYERWLPGQVRATSWLSVAVDYALPGRGSGTDTVMPAYVMARGAA